MGNNVPNVFHVNNVTYISRDVDSRSNIPVIQKHNGERVKHDRTSGDFLIFDYTFNPLEDKIITVVVQNPTTGVFKSRDSSRKIKSPIDREVYDKLSDSLKNLYVEIVDKKEVITEYNYTFIDLSERAKDLGNRVFYSRTDVLNNIERFNFKNNKRAHISVNFPRAFGYEDFKTGSIIVEFFEKEYNGETRKIYDKKKNGGYYADRRGKIVPDYPTVIDKLVITDNDIPFFSAKDQDEMEEKMQEYVDFITMTHLLPEKNEG